MACLPVPCKTMWHICISHLCRRWDGVGGGNEVGAGLGLGCGGAEHEAWARARAWAGVAGVAMKAGSKMGLILGAVMHEFKAVHGMPPVHLAPSTWADTKRLLQATGMTVQMGWYDMQ